MKTTLAACVLGIVWIGMTGCDKKEGPTPTVTSGAPAGGHGKTPEDQPLETPRNSASGAAAVTTPKPATQPTSKP